ncbi:MAG: hypothetical protein Q7J31_06800 [Syntrophales bacterium]|nr:hypothetical protein [Syntrophales bacterium]
MKNPESVGAKNDKDDPEAAFGENLSTAHAGGAMKVERKQLFHKNIFLGTVSLNAAKLGGLVA